jgi:pimeloyl-ACP methyl ester carboxylesterase
MASDPLVAGDHVYKPVVSGSVAQLSYSVFPAKAGRQNPILVLMTVGWGPGRAYANRGIAPLFQNEFNVVVASPRGSDESARPVDSAGNDDPTQMSTVSMADDIESLRRHLGISTIPVIMGHSNAGAICMAYAQRYPDRVDRVVSIDGRLLGWDRTAFQRFKSERENLPQYKDAYEAWTQPLPQTDEEFALFLDRVLPSYFVDPVRDHPIFSGHLQGNLPRLWNCVSQGGADRVYQRQLDSHGETKQMADLKTVKAKVLCAYGREDMMCAVESGQFIVDRINSSGGDATIHVYESCGHLPWIESKDEFVVRTLDWLKAS